MYGIGAPKTGTVSISEIFSNYRSCHEPHPGQFINLMDKMKDSSFSERIEHMKRRDRQWRYECEVAWYLGHAVEELVTAFPDAKFICTVRPPIPWLRSIINQCINAPRSVIDEGRRKIRDYSFGRPPDVYPAHYPAEFKTYNLPSIEGYLSYWSDHNNRVISAVPADRLLLIRTKNISTKLSEMSKFVGVNVSNLNAERSCRHKTQKKHNVVEKINTLMLKDKISEICKDTASLINENGADFSKKAK